MRIAMLVLGLICGQACAAEPLRVLFIGNSYTYVHDVPSLVAEFAAAQGRPIQAAMLARPDWSLAEHLKDRQLKTVLAQPWDWVVLQQGPSAQPLSREALVENTREMARRIKRAQSARRREALGQAPIGGAPQRASLRAVGSASTALQGPTRIAMFAAWPPLPLADSSPEAEESYRLAAEAVHGCVLPVSAAWRMARESGAAPRLYSDDQLHATRAGAVLAAMVIASALAGEVEPPALLAPGDAGAEEIARLQRLQAAAAGALAGETLRCESRS